MSSFLSLERIAIGVKTKLLIAILIGSMLLIALFANLQFFVLRGDYNNLYLRHTLLVSKLEKIKETYSINILETISDTKAGKIKQSDANEIIVLSKELIREYLNEYQKEERAIEPSKIVQFLHGFFPLLTTANDYELLISSSIKRADQMSLLLDSYLADPSSSQTNEIENLAKSIAVYLSQLIDHHFQSAVEEKERNSKVLRATSIIIGFLTMLVAVVATLLVVIITRDIERLQARLESEVAKKTKELVEFNEELQKRIEIEVKNSQEKDRIMYQQSRLAAMGEMVANIAHQWRQPLNALTMLIQSFQTKEMSGKLTSEFVANQTKEGLRIASQMSQTIENFRGFFVPHKNKGFFSASSCINEAVKIVESSYDLSGIKIVINIEKDVCLEGYSNELSQVILNLLANSFDVLSLTNPEHKIIQIAVTQNSDFGRIEVVDSGGGIDEAILEKIYDPYFTTKHQSNGTGIGLYMSRQIVEQMGGKMSARNIVQGFGSEALYKCASFAIELPACKRRDCGFGVNKAQKSSFC